MPESRPEPTPGTPRSGVRGWAAVLVLAVLVTAAAGYAASTLRLRTDIVDLLPDRPASQEYRRFLQVFGGLEKVYILIEEEDADDALSGERATAAATLLTERLQGSELLASARCGFTDEDELFLLQRVLPRAFLLTDVEPAAVAAKLEPAALDDSFAALRRAIRTPAGVGGSAWAAADPLGFAANLDLAAGVGGVEVDPVDGVFLGASGRTALVMATPTVAELDADSGERLEVLFQRVFAEVRAEVGEGITLQALGGPLYAARDARSVRRDLTRTLASSVLVIAVLLLAYFRRSWLPLLLLAAVLAGVVWAAAAARLVLGSLGVLSISFAAILVGLGVDYGIHAAHLFRRQQDAGLRPGPAMAAALRQAGPAVLASVATTMAAFAVLGTSVFHPLRELGGLVAMGIVVVLGASLAVGAPLAVLACGSAPRAPVARRLSEWTRRIAYAGGRHRAWILTPAALATVVALVVIPRLTFDTDLRSMRPGDDPARRLEERLAAEFGLGLDGFHVMVHAPDRDSALEAATRTDALLRELTAETGAAIRTPSRWVRGAAALRRRADAIRQATPGTAWPQILAAADRAGFRSGALALGELQAVLSGAAPAAVDPAQWPSWLAESVRETDGGAAVALQITAPVGTWPDGPPPQWTDRIAAEVPGASVVSIPALGAELRRTVADELRRLGGYCLLAVVLMVAFSFRGHPLRTLLGLLPVATGCVWLLGICAGFGIPVGLLSVAAAPLVLGIGIDDGLHALHGARQDGGLLPALSRVGPAMVLTSATTCAGFSSLLWSEIPAVRNGGLVVSLGVALCLLATLVILPAVAGLVGDERNTR